MKTKGSPSARRAGVVALAFSAGALLALDTGCADRAGIWARADGDVPDAGGAFPDLDAAGVGIDVPPPPMTDREADPTADDGAFAAACLDGVDGDGAGGVDCEDAACGTAPSCCVGATTSVCCTGGAGTLFTLAFAGCASATDCGAAADVVGSPVLGAGIVAAVGSGATEDSGVLVREPIDLRSGHVTLTARFVLEGVPGPMVDAVAVGLYGDDAGGARSLPVAAVQISASRGEVGIVAGDVVVASQALAPSAVVQTLTLSVTPTGRVTLVGDGISLTADVDVPDKPLRVGVLGRSEAGTTSPVRIESVEVSRAACDVPSALVPGAFALEDRTGLYDETSVASPTLAVAASGERYLAFDAERRSDGRRAIFLGAEDTARPGTFVVEATSGRPQPILASATFVEAVSDAALRWEADGGRWVLYATGLANGRRSIVRSAGASDGTFAFAEPVVIEAPEAEFVSGVEPERDSPAFVPGQSGVIVAREHTPAGTALVLLDVSSGDTAARADAVCGVGDECGTPSLRTSDTILTTRAGTFAFDADEVAAPSVAFHRGVYRMYYAGRRGLRWSIGVAISADARYWRRPVEGEVVLAPSGAGAAALGALDPDVSIDGAGEVAVFYTAWNGVDTSLALATQAIRR